MDTTYQIISGLIGVGIVLMIAPRVLAANRGKMLKTIAIWVGIFLLVALAYRTVGPGKDAPEAAVSATTSSPYSREAEPAWADEPIRDTGPTTDRKLKEEDGFSSPREE